MPGVSFNLNFKHYSGYFQVSDTHFLHYWFVESQSNLEKDPLIFWFNGGPGCSSLAGLLEEMGPYLVCQGGRSLRSNENSWNKLASVVYIESPAGVGYSYATDGNITTNDDLTSLENYEAVKQFFKAFPQYRQHATFIMGESYGGMYVPILTARIVDGQKDFLVNLKGIAIGNGCVNDKLDFDTKIKYAYGHGMISEKMWNTLRRECCEGTIDTCHFEQLTGYCATMVKDILQSYWYGLLNMYDLYRDCDHGPTINSEKMTYIVRDLAARYKYAGKTKKYDNLMKFLHVSHTLYGITPCINSSDINTYMNEAQVRTALNIPSSLAQWDVCSDQIFVSYQQQYEDMAPFIKKIVAANVRVLLYYGDTDMVCNFMMGQQFADQLGLQTHKFSPDDNLASVNPAAIKVRPIVSCVGGPTDKIGWLLNSVLGQLLKFIPAHLSNTNMFLESLRRTQLSATCVMESFDVAALYNNVSNDSAMEAILELLSQHQGANNMFGFSISQLMTLLKECLSCNIFRWSGRYFAQIRGLAIGQRLAPTLAVAFMSKIEAPVVSRLALLYCRYVDDCFIVCATQHEMDKCFEVMNSQSEYIKLTREKLCGNSLPFLNVQVQLAGNSYITKWYRKPSCKNIIVHSRSAHPHRTKEAVVRNMFRTAVSVCTGGGERKESLETQVEGGSGKRHYLNYENSISGAVRLR
ncbi:unnamed protein product [Heligmosomoides polygyrus]|uniref:Carboxypeptidase n=1 Tax=Heligmosomoides polygyrus TaxID=6339 RepID=A0A3P8B8V3_HELPZ|nr:unnamed protein product [Heligmosomoides polygyrus]